MDLFIKYHTLLPRAAAVERLFSMGSDVLRTKSFLMAKNFEMLIFMKGSLKMLNMNNQMRQEKEDVVPDPGN